MAGLNNVINDFARRPPQFKIAVFVGLGVVLGLLYWQFLLSPLSQKRDEARQAITSLEGERDKLTSQEKEYRELVEKRERLERVTKNIDRVLPTGAELPAFFEMLDRKFSEAGVEVKKVSRLAEVNVDAFKKVPVEIEITGTYLQIKRFFASLAGNRTTDSGQAESGPTDGALEQDRIITVQDFSLKRAPGRSNNADLLTAKFTAATFRQESEAPAPASGAAKPAGSSAAAPATSGAKGDATSKAKAAAAEGGN